MNERYIPPMSPSAAEITIDIMSLALEEASKELKRKDKEIKKKDEEIELLKALLKRYL
jgi:DNA-binding winged helix-turn-helix (wHTH) protein